MEKTTTIELEFSSLNDYEATVTLTRKGKVERVVFELGKREASGRNARGEPELHFHFKGDRSQLSELCNFMALILSDSKTEFESKEDK